MVSVSVDLFICDPNESLERLKATFTDACNT